MENFITSESSVTDLKLREQNPEEKLIIDTQGKANLISTAKWANFISIVGMVMVGVLVLIGILMILLSSAFNDFQDFSPYQNVPLPFVAVGFFYLIMAALYFIPCYYLLQFAKKIRLGMRFDSQERLNEGLLFLKKLAKFVGVITIVILALALLIIPLILLSAGMMMLS